MEAIFHFFVVGGVLEFGLAGWAAAGFWAGPSGQLLACGPAGWPAAGQPANSIGFLYGTIGVL